MNTQSIDAMNLTIAEFMGYYHNAGKFYSTSGGADIWFKDAKYHSSWEWLHTAWKKLFNIMKQRDSRDRMRIEFEERFQFYMETNMVHSEIDCAHDLLFNAIQWYNSNMAKNDNDCRGFAKAKV